MEWTGLENAAAQSQVVAADTQRLEKQSLGNDVEVPVNTTGFVPVEGRNLRAPAIYEILNDRPLSVDRRDLARVGKSALTALPFPIADVMNAEVLPDPMDVRAAIRW